MKNEKEGGKECGASLHAAPPAAFLASACQFGFAIRSRVIEVSDRRQWYKIGSKAFTKPAAAGDVRGPAQEGAQPREQC